MGKVYEFANRAEKKQKVRTTPLKPKNTDRRPREHLTILEIQSILEHAGSKRNYALILMGFRHGLRVTELCTLEWAQIDFAEKTIFIRREKGGDPSTHYLGDDELSLLAELPRQARYIFTASNGVNPMPRRTAFEIIASAGRKAKLPFPIHPHQLRHAKGFQLAFKGTDTRAIQAYLGHKNIQHTVRYTALVPDRFRSFSNDLK
jgi:type 1 fimbriae regulatory protein FimB/type 1 fimbriae regulatory protein FimE